MLFRGEGARPGKLVGFGCPVDEVAPANNQVVAAGEKAVGGLQARGLAGGRELALAHARGQHPRAHDVHDVVVAHVRGQVSGHAVVVGLGGHVPVVEVPVVVGDDFEQVRDTPKFGDRVAELVGGQGVELFPRAVVSAYEARFFGRRLQVALGTERAIVPVSLVVDGGAVGARRGERPVSAAGDGPHLCAGEQVLLFDGAVGESHDGAVGAGKLRCHVLIVPVVRVGSWWRGAIRCARPRLRRARRCGRAGRDSG